MTFADQNSRAIRRLLRSSLEAEVDLIVPGDLHTDSRLLQLLQREGLFALVFPGCKILNRYGGRGFSEDSLHCIGRFDDG
jgi:hypothetical protein